MLQRSSLPISMPTVTVLIVLLQMNCIRIGNVVNAFGQQHQRHHKRGFNHKYRRSLTTSTNNNQQHHNNNNHNDSPKITITTTTMQHMLPRLPSSFEYDDEVVFYQRATGTRIRGRKQFEQTIKQWTTDFQSAVGDSDGDGVGDGIGDGDDGVFTKKNNHDHYQQNNDNDKENDNDSSDNSRADNNDYNMYNSANSNSDNINNNNNNNNQLLRNIQIQTSVVTMTSPTTLLIRWNYPSIHWLLTLTDIIPNWEPDYRCYIDQTNIVRTFSYKSFFRLFTDAIKKGKLRIPLACIEGITTYEFIEECISDIEEIEQDIDNNTAPTGTKNNINNNNTTAPTTTGRRRKIRSIIEDLAYAQDLQRGALSNRICARDLQFFLEIARKPLHYEQLELGNNNNNNNNNSNYWEDHVTSILPWRSVPGMMDPLYIEALSEEDGIMVPISFGIFSIIAVLLFANTIAPELIGQSLFGSPSYIVSPSELNDIIRY